MSKVQNVIGDIHLSDDGGRKFAGKSGLHPLSRLSVTFFFILTVISFSKYEMSGLVSMAVYLIIIGILHEYSFRMTLWRILPALVPLGILGLANLFLDQSTYGQMGSITITKGMVSMAVLILKGVFCIIAVYFLILMIGMEGICYSLRKIHMPEEFVTVLFLIYRYLIVLLKETQRLMQAYKLRAPGQRGLHVKTWGAFVGQLLLRSMDRGERVYESMQLRGYGNEYHDVYHKSSHGYPLVKALPSILYVLAWAAVFLCLRFFPVFQIVGGFNWKTF